MIDLNPLYVSKDDVLAILATAIGNLKQGVIITEFISEGTQFKGFSAANTTDVINACTRYLEEYDGILITETQPNFSGTTNIFYGQV
jgi:hypothetical protein